MTSAFSLQNSTTLCPASFCIRRPITNIIKIYYMQGPLLHGLFLLMYQFFETIANTIYVFERRVLSLKGTLTSEPPGKSLTYNI